MFDQMLERFMSGSTDFSHPGRFRAVALAATLAFCGASAQADERAELVQLRATTMALMQALIDSGLLPKDKADEIVKQAQRAGNLASNAAESAPLAAQDAPAGEKAKPPVIRVPYISESAKSEMRQQLKQEVLAQARAERWGEPGAMPDWLSRITLEGDIRVRFQDELFDRNNLAPDASNGYLNQTGYDASGSNLGLNGAALAWSPDLANTQHNRDRMTLRARLGLRSDLGEGVSAGVRLSTGNTSGVTSTSQTLGNSFNKYSVVLDRAYIKYQGASGVQGSAGRFANPFFSSDLTWPDDLNFDGVAATYTHMRDQDQALFLTAGAFPLKEFEASTHDKWLYGAQIGGAFKVTPKTMVRVGLAAYRFQGVEGRADTALAPTGASATANPALSSTTEYPRDLRLKGNTLFRVNQSDLSGSSTWGLASKFTPIDLNADFTFNQFDPFAIRLSVDYVQNIGFNIDEIRQRTNLGTDTEPLQLAKQTAAFQTKVTVGAAQIDRPGQWQAMLAFRRLERDAWVDAFTDTTWHLGGTNYQGWSLGAQYGVAPRTSLGVRWTSTRSLPDSTLYSAGSFQSTGISDQPLKIDVLQVELNTRF